MAVCRAFDYNTWVVANNRDIFLHSAAAGDMNPASERNNHCKGCSDDGGKMSSWAYVTDSETSIALDKIKVSCENDEEFSESSNMVDHSGDSDESSGALNTDL